MAKKTVVKKTVKRIGQSGKKKTVKAGKKKTVKAAKKSARPKVIRVLPVDIIDLTRKVLGKLVELNAPVPKKITVASMKKILKSSLKKADKNLYKVTIKNIKKVVANLNFPPTPFIPPVSTNFMPLPPVVITSELPVITPELKADALRRNLLEQPKINTPETPKPGEPITRNN